MSTRSKSSVALLLTFASGYIDLVGFLAFYSTFTAHMTGVTVHLAQHAATLDTGAIEVLAGVLACFVGGSILGRFIVEFATYRSWRTAASYALLLEAALVIMVAALGDRYPAVNMTLALAAAMGLQTAALTRVGALTVHTTFVTGMLNKLAQQLSHAIFLSLGRLGERNRRSHDRVDALRQSAFFASIWLCYFVGALSGAIADSHWSARSLFVPGALVTAVAIFDQVDPLSIEEERDASER